MAYAGASGWQAVGRGLRGIGAQIGQDRRYQAETERLDKARLRREGREDMNTDIALAGMGGGRGPMPTIETPPPPSPMDTFQAPELFPEPGKAGDALLGPTPSLGGPTPTINLPDTERFMPVGPEGSAYITRPEVQAREEADLAKSDAARDSMLFSERIIPYLDRVMAGKGTAEDFAAMIADGLDPTKYEPEVPEPVEPPKRPLPTNEQAWNRLGDLYPSEYAGERGLSPGLRAPIAEAMAAGDPVNFPDPGQVARGIELPPDYYISEPVHGSLHDTVPVPEPVGTPGALPTPAVVDDSAWLSNPQALDAIRQLEASNLPDKASRIAEVKRRAAEMAGGR